MRSHVSAATGGILAAAMLSLSTPTVAQASGPVLWQVTTSLHCDTVNMCLAGPEQRLGGDGGPVTFFADGTAVAEFTTYEHFFATGPAVGATHISFAISGWDIEPAGPFALIPGGEDFYWLAGTATITSRSGPPLVASLADVGAAGDTGLPAAPGHYTADQLLGQKTPGVVIEILVQSVSGSP
jgi:hypothetical protein